MTLHKKIQLDYLKRGLLKPEELTVKALNQKDESGQTAWHVASWFFSLQYIPKHLFTSEDLSQTNNHGETVWHVAAQFNTINAIPRHLLTVEALSKPNKYGVTVWEHIVENNTLQHIPVHLITSNLLKMRKSNNKLVFGKRNANYINKVVSERLKTETKAFFSNNPSLSNAIEFADPRFKLKEANLEKLVFEFQGMHDDITLNKDGIFLGNKSFASLNHAGLYIETHYFNIEQSIILPANNIPLESFVL